MANATEGFNRFMASVGQDESLQEEKKKGIPNEFLADLQYLTNPAPQTRIVPQDSIEAYDQYIQPEENTYRTSRGVGYTLDDLEKDSEFQETAGRFLEEVGRDENIFEYLRDADWSLTAAMARSMEIGKWSDQAKQDYLYLKDTFDKASLGGARQTFGMIKDLTVDILTDPIELAAIAAAPFTLGASQGTKELVKLSVKQALKKKQKAELRQSLKKDVKRSALFTSLEGAAWAGPHDYFLQQADVELGLRDQIDASQIALTGTLAAAMGGTLGGSIGLLTGTSPLLMHKLSKYSNEIKIKRHVDSKGKNPKEQNENLNDDFEVENKEDKYLPNFLKVIAETVGKPTTALMKAGKSFDKLGDHLGLYRYDWYRTVSSGVREGIDKLSFGEYFANMRSEWHTELEKALVNIDRTGKSKKYGFNAFWIKRLDDKQNDHLFYLLTTRDNPKQRKRTMPYGQYSGTEISQETRKAARQIGNLLDKMQEEAARKSKHKWITRKGKRVQVLDPNRVDEDFDQLLRADAKLKNYFPHKLQASAIEANRPKFEQMLMTYGRRDPVTGETIVYAKPDNSIAPSEIEKIVNEFGEIVEGPKLEGLKVDEKSFGEDFIARAREQLGEEATQEEVDILAMDLKAKRIVDDILGLRDDPLLDFELEAKIGQKIRTSGRTGFLKERVFSAIPEEEMYEFIDTSVEGVLNDYATNAALMIAREQKFGRSLDVYATRHLKPIIQQLEDEGVSVEERKEIARRLVKMYKRTSGVEVPTPFGKGKTRLVFDGMKTIQTFAHLPLATLSSLTEPFILLGRVQSKDSGKAAYDVGNSIVKELRKTNERFQNGIKRQFGIKHKGTSDFADEAWVEAYKVGLALEQAVYDRLEGLYGEMADNRLQTMTRGFFKTTFLTQWTSAVQLAAFTTGKRLILENTQRLATNKDLFGNKLSEGARGRFSEELRQLGVDEKRAIKWYNSSLDPNGNFDIVRAKRKRGFYENDYMMGANRFAREIILVPDTTEANKPLWYSHPVGQLFAQFASYPTAFNNTVLKRFAYEISEDVRGVPQGRLPVATPKIAATAIMMTTISGFNNMVRSGGKSLEKPEGQILIDSIDRWGGLGPMQYAYRFWENAQYGGGPIGSVAKAGSGPLIQDILDSILYRKGLAENMASNVPFYALLPNDAKTALRTEGKNIDKALFSPFAKAKKPKQIKKQYALYQGPSTYGQVYAKGGLVTDVAQVPEEPDERIDRMTGLPYHMQAGILGQDEEERFGFAIGGLPRALRSTIGLAKNKRGTAFRTRWQDEDNLRIVDERRLKRLQKEGESLAIVTMQTARELLEDGQITIKEARALLREAGYKKQSIYKFIRTYKDAGYAKGDKFVTYRSGFAEGGQVGETEAETYSLITKDIRKLAPIFKDEDSISTYTEKELKGYAKGITEPVYRTINKNTAQQDAEDFRDADRIGVHLSTEAPDGEGVSLKGYVRMVRPLDLSNMDVPLKGFEFVEEVQNNKELQNKIIEDAVVSKEVAEEYIEDLLFHHSLKKQSIKQKENLPNLESILNIVASHKIREILKDIGYDGIIYEGEGLEPVDEQMERIQKFAGGPFFRKAASKIIKRRKKGIAFDRNQHRVTQEEMFEEWMNDPETLFVYADNETRGAMADIAGSDAEKARKLENTIGIRTKRIPKDNVNAYYNDYRTTRNKKQVVNKEQMQKRHLQMNEDMANVIRKFMAGGYKKIVFSDDLLKLKDFKEAKTAMTQYSFNKKFQWTKKYLDDYLKVPEGTAKDFKLGATGTIERDIAQNLYGSKFVPKNKTIDPIYKTPTQKSKLAIGKPMDKPRGATAKDLGVPEDDALYAKGNREARIKELQWDDEDAGFFAKIEAMKDPESDMYNPDMADEMYSDYLYQKYPQLFRGK